MRCTCGGDVGTSSGAHALIGASDTMPVVVHDGVFIGCRRPCAGTVDAVHEPAVARGRLP